MKVIYKLHPKNPITNKFRAEPLEPFVVFDLVDGVNISDHIKNKFRAEMERGRNKGFEYVVVDLSDIISELDIEKLINI